MFALQGTQLSTTLTGTPTFADHRSLAALRSSFGRTDVRKDLWRSAYCRAFDATMWSQKGGLMQPTAMANLVATSALICAREIDMHPINA